MMWKRSAESSYQEGNPSPGTPRPLCKWKPPDMGFWKPNADASYIGDSDDTCLGVVARDHRGSVALSFCRKIKPTASAEEAEAKAIKVCMEELAKLYHGRLIIESDCLSIIYRLKSGGVDKSQLHHIVQDIRDQIGHFHSVSWSTTKREGNKLYMHWRSVRENKVTAD